MDSGQNSVQQISPAPSEDSDVGLFLPEVPKENGPQTVSLAVLMDFAIQQTLYELTILSEMLPIKDQNERKKAILCFAHATRLMFVKLLSIVKWLKQSKKFEPLTSICYVLDQQAQCFIETADKLCELARVELQHARLPMFQVSTAIDVLTTGSYPRLPMIIKDAFVPEEKLTPFETRQTILLLNEKLIYYLSKAINTIPKRVSVFKIHNGTIIMRVKGEFQVRMTILPRKKPEAVILSVAILIRDYDIGSGQELVHPLQLNTIHEVLQSRVAFHPEPFIEAYKFLHHFCMGLQLDVFECQTRKLMTDIAPNYVRVEAYDPYEGYLVVRYWINERIQPAQQNQHRAAKLLSTGTIYRMKLYIDREDIDIGIRIRHTPSSAIDLIDVLSTEDEFTMGQILSEVISVRIRERLMLIRQILLQVSPKVPANLTGDAIPTITYELLVHEKKSHPDEHLVVSVNAFYGQVVCQVSSLGNIEELRQLEKELNGACLLSEVEKIINRLRILLMINRYRNAAAVSQVKLITEAQLPIISTLKGLPRDRLMLQFTREPHHFLVVTFEPSKTTGIQIRFRMVTRNPETNKLISMEVDPIRVITEMPVPTFYHPVLQDAEKGDEEPIDYEHGKLKPVRETVVEALATNTIDILEPRKRSPWVGTEDQVKTVIAAMEDRLIFLRIGEELDKKGIKHEPLVFDPVVGGPVLRITDMRHLAPPDCEDFFETLISASIRVDSRRNLYWPLEYTVREQPLLPNFYQNRAMGNLKIIPANTLIAKMVQFENKRIGADQQIRYITQEISTAVKESIGESVVENIIERTAMYSHLYGPVRRFSRVYHHYEKVVDVVSYNYQKLILAYGPRRNYTVTVSWKPQPASFAISFGQFYYIACEDTDTSDYQKRINPHHIVQRHLTEKFNKHRDLIDLVEYVVNTSLSIYCLTQLSRNRIRPAKVPAHIDPQPNYAVEYQIYIHASSEYKIRITVGPVHLEVFLLSKNAVSIQDVTPERPLARGLHSFVDTYKNKTFREEDFMEFREEFETIDSEGVMPVKAPEDLRPPASLQSNPPPANDIPNPRSLPEPCFGARNSKEEDVEMTSAEASAQESLPSRNTIYLTCRQLLRLCTDLDSQGVPFINYLTSLSEHFGQYPGQY